MDTYIVYCDETGDDGRNTASSTEFILTSVYMPCSLWQSNYDTFKNFRKDMKLKYGFHIREEMHTKHFLTDKNPYRDYNWSAETKRNILKEFTLMISSLSLSVVNVVIDKTNIASESYGVLENALTYNIQRIENASQGNWNFIMIADSGRLAPMRRTARAIRAFNPIRSQFGGYVNKPIKGMIEDVMEKDSRESYFIQICDFISYFVHLYYITTYKRMPLPNRVANLIDVEFVGRVMATFAAGNILNVKASNERYGLVIYPKK